MGLIIGIFLFGPGYPMGRPSSAPQTGAYFINKLVINFRASPEDIEHPSVFINSKYYLEDNLPEGEHITNGIGFDEFPEHCDQSIRPETRLAMFMRRCFNRLLRLMLVESECGRRLYEHVVDTIEVRVEDEPFEESVWDMDAMLADQNDSMEPVHGGFDAWKVWVTEWRRGLKNGEIP